jgi:hypothetical protein
VLQQSSARVHATPSLKHAARQASAGLPVTGSQRSLWHWSGVVQLEPAAFPGPVGAQLAPVQAPPAATEPPLVPALALAPPLVVVLAPALPTGSNPPPEPGKSSAPPVAEPPAPAEPKEPPLLPQP